MFDVCVSKIVSKQYYPWKTKKLLIKKKHHCCWVERIDYVMQFISFSLFFYFIKKQCLTRLPFFDSSGLHEWTGAWSWALKGRERKAQKTATTGIIMVREITFLFRRIIEINKMEGSLNVWTNQLTGRCCSL